MNALIKTFFYHRMNHGGAALLATKEKAKSRD
jgi:hypothetical protein